MRRFIATCLLLCMVLLVPATASPLRVCFRDALELMPECSGSEKTGCKPDCDGQHEDSCCLEVKKLPDGLVPLALIHFTAPQIVDLCRFIWPEDWIVTGEIGVPSVSVPIRGPTSPAAWRAVLGVWTV